MGGGARKELRRNVEGRKTGGETPMARVADLNAKRKFRKRRGPLTDGVVRAEKTMVAAAAAAAAMEGVADGRRERKPEHQETPLRLRVTHQKNTKKGFVLCDWM
jgi:hypothetical protein